MLQYIVWSHKHGTETVNFDGPELRSEKAAWAALQALTYNAEPDLFEQEFIEDYGPVTEPEELTIEDLDKAFEEIKEQWLERCAYVNDAADENDRRPPSEDCPWEN